MIEIVYQDKFLFVINKPAGLNSIADGYDPTLPYVRSLLEPQFQRLWVVHRLDKDTSGLMILARTAVVHRLLCAQFLDRSVQKQYLALVYGCFPDHLRADRPLRINGDRRHRTVVDNTNGKQAITDFSLVENYGNGTSQISAFPHTGYTHQIRAHVFNLGFPILGDPLYYSKESLEFSKAMFIKRTMLHSYKITFLHPVENIQMDLTARIPDDISQTIQTFK